MTSPVGYRQFMLGLNVDAYWPLNETSGTTAFDQSVGSSKALTISGTPALASGRAVGRPAQQVLLFDGTDDYCEGTAYTAASPVSVFAWVYQRGVTAARMWIAAQGDATTYAFALYVNASQQLQATIWQSAGAAVMDVTAPTKFIPYRWTQVGFTWNNSTPLLALYQDGMEIARSTSTTGSVGTQATFAIGRRPDNANSKWNGYIGHVGYWTGGTGDELTPYQIRHLYTRGLPLLVPSERRRLVRL